MAKEQPSIRNLRRTGIIRRGSIESSNPGYQPFPLNKLFKGCQIEKKEGEDPRFGKFNSIISTNEPKNSHLHSRELKVFKSDTDQVTGYEWSTTSNNNITKTISITEDFFEGRTVYANGRDVSWSILIKDGQIANQHFNFSDGNGQFDIRDLTRGQVRELKKAGFDPNQLLVLSNLVTKNKGEKKDINMKTALKFLPLISADEVMILLSGFTTLSGIVLSEITDIRMEKLALAGIVFLSSIYKSVKDVSLQLFHQNDRDAVDNAKSLAWKSKDLQLILSTYVNSLLYLFRK